MPTSPLIARPYASRSPTCHPLFAAAAAAARTPGRSGRRSAPRGGSASGRASGAGGLAGSVVKLAVLSLPVSGAAAGPASCCPGRCSAQAPPQAAEARASTSSQAASERLQLSGIAAVADLQVQLKWGIGCQSTPSFVLLSAWPRPQQVSKASSQTHARARTRARRRFGRTRSCITSPCLLVLQRRPCSAAVHGEVWFRRLQATQPWSQVALRHGLDYSM